eukprot:TRINITY_DN8740_c0_g1_i2.p1 TRINITY_DN8740_c0_g1~~TRINITY_DN8740_c0_g1_i2.p1  ORF type:complete len:525 (+),score=31.09 TRINITY_DN8740_c0_g1_i2:95-1576(+)
MQGSGGSPRKGLPTVRCCPACQVDYGWAKMTNLNNKGPAAELSKKQLRNALAHYTGRGPAVARRRCEAIGGALFGVARAIEALETGPQRAQASCAHALLELHSVARLLTGPVCSPFCASFSAGSATHTVAGIPCENGDCDGAVSTARTCRPTDVAVDPATGAVYIVDLDNHALRRLYRGKLETVAGNGSEGRGQLHNPYGVAVCSDGSVLVAHMHRVVLVEDPFGETPITRTLAGSHQEGYVDGSSSHARFTNPCGVAIFPAVGIAVSVCGFSPGEEVAAIADSGNHVIRLVNRKGRVRTLAGNGEKGGIDGNPKSAAFDEPSDISVCPGGKALIVVDTSRLRRISLDPPGVSTLIKFDFLPCPPQALSAVWHALPTARCTSPTPSSTACAACGASTASGRRPSWLAEPGPGRRGTRTAWCRCSTHPAASTSRPLGTWCWQTATTTVSGAWRWGGSGASRRAGSACSWGASGTGSIATFGRASSSGSRGAPLI